MKKYPIIVIASALVLLHVNNDARNYEKQFAARYVRPVRSEVITSFFGERRDPLKRKNIGGRTWKHHFGVDLGGAKGAFIYAADDGTVIYSRRSRGGYGNAIMIRHADGSITLYGHLSERFNHYGDRVKRGQSIGVIGTTGKSTGIHLHFSVIKSNGKQADPIPFYKSRTMYF